MCGLFLVRRMGIGSSILQLPFAQERFSKYKLMQRVMFCVKMFYQFESVFFTIFIGFNGNGQFS